MGSAVVMGFAITGLHYSADVRFVPTAAPWQAPEGLLPTAGLAPAVVVSTLVILGFALMATLVDRRHRAQLARYAQLQESEIATQRLAAIVQSSEDAVISHALDGTILTWNAGAERILGYPAAEAVGRSILLVVPEEKHEEEREILEQVGRGEARSAYATVRINKDGRPVPVSLSVTPARDAEGRVVAASAIARDITERKRIEEDLRASNERYQLVGRATQDAIWEWDIAAGQLTWGEGIHTTFGYAAEEVRSTLEWCSARIHPEDLPGVVESLDDAVAGEAEAWSREYRFLRANGSYADVLDRGIILRDEQGQATRMIGSVADLTERRRAEGALRESERRNEKMLAAIPDLIIRFTRAGEILDVHAPDASQLSVPPERIVGRNIREILPPDTAEQILAHAEQAVARGEVETFEYSLSVPAGMQDFEARLVSIGPDEIIAMVRNVTLRRQMEEELRRKEAYYRALIENASDVITIVDADGTIRYESPSVERVTGWKPEELVGRNAFEFIHPDDVPHVMDTLGQAVQNPRQVYRYDLRFQRKDGSWRVLEGLARNLLDDPAVQGVVANSRDVTEQRGIAQELLQRERQLNEAQEIARVGSWNHDLTTDEVTWSDQMYRIFGMDPERSSLTFEEIMERVHPEDRDLVAATYVASLDTGEPFSAEYRVLLPDGAVRDAHGRGRVEVDLDGNPCRSSGTVQDITERKQVEREIIRAKVAAEAASRAKSDFLSSMSHELRTPLNSVIGFANILRKNKGGSLREQDLNYLERIVSNGKHLLGLINDILDLSRIEAGKMELEIAPVALDELIAETLDQLQGAVRGKEVELRASTPDGLALLETDATRLKQILINLVGNAIRFTERGSVTVSVAAEPGKGRPVRIDVRDTGIGIPPERLSAIFQAFEQAESGTSRRFGGTGLGLAISSSLSEMMGYRLDVESTVGEGSTFRILLDPERSARAAVSTSNAGRDLPALPAAEMAPEPEGVDFRSKLVLIIDDETDARMLLTYHLEDFGCQTIAASSGEQGLRMAREFRPDLITLDLLMPEMGGWEILRALKADPELCDIPVVVVSVAVDEARGNVLGTVDLLEKPIRQHELLVVLRRNLRSMMKGRVLVVDDDKDARDLLSTYLREEEVEVRCAENGKEALRSLESFAPDLIVLDLLMPELDGIGLLRILQANERYRHIPVVVVTARDLSSTEIRSLGREVGAVLRKDAELEADLRAVIQHICKSQGQVGSSIAGAPGPPHQ